MHFVHKTEWAVNLTLSYIYWYMNLHSGISSSLVEMEEMIEFYFNIKNKSNFFINELIIRISYFILWFNTPPPPPPPHTYLLGPIPLYPVYACIPLVYELQKVLKMNSW